MTLTDPRTSTSTDAAPTTERPLGTVLVTGGSSGLGEAIALSVQRQGGTAVSIDVQPPRIDVEHTEIDLGWEDAEARIRKIIERRGGVDAVVTAAGIDACGPLSDVPTDQWERVIAVNLLGTVRTVRAALPWLVERNGRVVTIASTLGWRALPEATAYCASKFGVVGFTRALASELASQVDVSLVLPGGMATHFFDTRPEKYRPPADMELASPQAIADCVVFALSRPSGCHVRELMVTGTDETSWP